jgi:hypothetical protein
MLSVKYDWLAHRRCSPPPQCAEGTRRLLGQGAVVAAIRLVPASQLQALTTDALAGDSEAAHTLA